MRGFRTVAGAYASSSSVAAPFLGSKCSAGSTIFAARGSLTGGGPDQVKFGTNATGLTAAQLAQIQWPAPNGGADITGAQILSTGEIVPAASPTPATITAPMIVGGQIVFQVVPGSPAQTSVVQWATNLTAPIFWENVATNTGTFSFTNAAVLPESYYRILAQ